MGKRRILSVRYGSQHAPRTPAYATHTRPDCATTHMPRHRHKTKEQRTQPNWPVAQPDHHLARRAGNRLAARSSCLVLLLAHTLERVCHKRPDSTIPTPLQPSNTGTRQGQKRRGRSSIPSACGAARPPPRRLAGLLLASYFPYYKDIKALDTTRLPPGQAIVLLSAPTSSHYKDLARAGVRHGYHLSRKAIVSSRLDHGLLCGKGRPNHP